MTEPKYDPTTQPYDEPSRHVDRTDIVAWLRLTDPKDKTASGILQEAADEIERLRDGNGNLLLEVSDLHIKIGGLNAEIERLRELLAASERNLEKALAALYRR